MTTIRALQERLFASTDEYFLFGDAAIAPRVREAFFAVPRHRFVRRYRDFITRQWHDVTPENLEEHLPLLYRDGGLAIGEDSRGEAVTISGPSWVLYSLSLLDVQPGHRVFEVGTGSGYNAALLGELASPGGRVVSCVIVPSLAAHAREVITHPNVEVIEGDAGAPYAGEPFDRIVFTAGAYDLPAWMHERVKPGGLVLMALKLPAAGDYLVLFRREPAGYFESLSSRACEVVWMRGASQPDLVHPPPTGAPDRTRAFPFGGRFAASFGARTHAFCSYLAIREPHLRAFDDPRGWPYGAFGLEDEGSLVVARDGRLERYGSDVAERALFAHLHAWVDEGMPSAETMRVRAYPAGTAPSEGHVVRRAATDFVWSGDEVREHRSGVIDGGLG